MRTRNAWAASTASRSKSASREFAVAGFAASRLFLSIATTHPCYNTPGGVNQAGKEAAHYDHLVATDAEEGTLHSRD